MSDAQFPADTFPRQQARTRRYTLGRPRTFTVAEDGSRVAFLRSRASDDPVGCLWVFDVSSSTERVVFDPVGSGEEHLSAEERDRRERRRESLTGVTDYATDRAGSIAAFAMDAGLHVADLVNGGARRVDIGADDPFDPRPDPTGRHIAYVAGGALRVVGTDGADDHELASDPDPDVSWGLAEFVAAEEMERLRGYWWSPEGDRLAVARVDERPVDIWHIAAPIDPGSPSRPVRYPGAGTDNAVVTLAIVDLAGRRVDVEWDRDAFPYLVNVDWNAHGPLTVLVESRDQRTMQILRVDPDTGANALVREDHDDRWLDITVGVPAWLPDGRLVRTVDVDDTKRLTFDDEPVTPVGLQVAQVLDVGEGVVFRANEDPTETHVWRVDVAGTLTPLTDEPGVHTAVVGSNVTVLTSATMTGLPSSRVLVDGASVGVIASTTETPVLFTAPTFFVGGARELRMALFTPGSAEPDGPLPVLLDPYGGPHFAVVQKVLTPAARVAVVRRPGVRGARDRRAGNPGSRSGLGARGVPGPRRIPCWRTRSTALHAAAEAHPFIDLDRVAIRGWSFGGFLAAMAVLRRPDVFHAAVSRRSRHGRHALRHALHRAVPGHARHRRRGVRALPPARRRAEPHAAAPPDPRARRRQRLRGEHAAVVEGVAGGRAGSTR